GEDAAPIEHGRGDRRHARFRRLNHGFVEVDNGVHRFTRIKNADYALTTSAWSLPERALRQAASNSDTSVVTVSAALILIIKRCPPTRPSIAKGALLRSAMSCTVSASAGSKLMMIRDGDSLKRSVVGLSVPSRFTSAPIASRPSEEKHDSARATASPPSEQSCAESNRPASAAARQAFCTANSRWRSSFGTRPDVGTPAIVTANSLIARSSCVV